jgi:hypothetical protein
MDLPQTGNYLDASDRARLPRDHKVRFGEAEGATAIFTLVIGPVDGIDGPSLLSHLPTPPTASTYSYTFPQLPLAHHFLA